MELNTYVYSTYDRRPITEWSAISYGHLHQDSGYSDDTTRVVLPSYLTGSDYCGSIVERSNYEAFKREFEIEQGVWWWDVHGGHGTYGIALHTNWESHEEIAEFINALSVYPVADECLLSVMEHEAEDEAWEGCYESDFICGLEDKFDVELGECLAAAIYELCRELMEQENIYWVHETGDSVYLDVSRLLKGCERSQVMALRGVEAAA